MNIYILESVNQLTCNYHSGGGIAIVAESVEDAKQLVSVNSDIKIEEQEWASAHVLPVITEEKRYWVFPDAGCC